MTIEQPSPPAFTVRRATADDVPTLVRLRLAFDLELAGELAPDRAAEHRAEVEAYLADRVPDGRFLAWVAEAADGARDGAQLIGMAGMIPLDRPPHPGSRHRGEGFVFNVYTVPGWRRRGVARALMEAAIAHARAAGLRRVLLRTSEAGRPVYRALGFVDPGYYRQLDLD